MKRFAVKIPESRKTIFLLDKSYFVKLPEIVFAFDIKTNYDQRLFCQMRCFFHKDNNFYFCLFPNLGTSGQICFDMKNHETMVFCRDQYNEKQFVSKSITNFFSSKFSTYSHHSKIFLLTQGSFNHSIKEGVNYIDQIYSYWEKNSHDDNFCILNNDMVVSNPLNSNNANMKFYESFIPNIADIPYLKDYLKDKKCSLLATA